MACWAWQLAPVEHAPLPALGGMTIGQSEHITVLILCTHSPTGCMRAAVLYSASLTHSPITSSIVRVLGERVSVSQVADARTGDRPPTPSPCSAHNTSL